MPMIGPLRRRSGEGSKRPGVAAWRLVALAAALCAAPGLALAGSATPRQTAQTATAAPPPGAGIPGALDAQLAADATQARLSFTVTAPLEPRVSVLEKPDRIVLDLPEVNFPAPLDLGRKGRGLVKSLRYGMVAPGRSRIVIELASPALPGEARNEPAAGGALSFSIELRKTDREAYSRQAVAALPPLPQSAAPKPAPAGDRRPVVVLDPGHGGIDTGAIGIAQTIEKDVALAFTRELRDKLEKSGLVRVVMTRDGDSFVSLGERVRMAQAQQASLFVSIHADTLTVSPEVRGLTVYTNSDRASDAEAARLAESENLADSAVGLALPETYEDIAGILGDLTVRETRNFSHLFARTLLGQLDGASRLNKNPARSAGFVVLRAPDVPSVLVELGYLSSKSDVELLKTAAWRDKASDAIAAAVISFLAPRLAHQETSN
ncbi:N-acetylmuramoyl-L-alanine amidase [Alsobacter sp. SYSU M60028]|uniref:N-acetylmuramoyl-L-alanine amidase n=1 Tax=Alsobacter ponti TaxID=2962936 RepID=A0ABT1LGV5_9HYPH|nr:N-acetylmuramoyl-L-alanine amidase [Alsobacter ponti]MCP8939483.1 N-acetylmuramoyl-L-alanine amidase [Alsobacter ponti]